MANVVCVLSRQHSNIRIYHSKGKVSEREIRNVRQPVGDHGMQNIEYHKDSYEACHLKGCAG